MSCMAFNLRTSFIIRKIYDSPHMFLIYQNHINKKIEIHTILNSILQKIRFQNGERGILIYRTSDTRIPNPLLIDLPPHSDSPLDQTPFGTVPSLSDTEIGRAHV